MSLTARLKKSQADSKLVPTIKSGAVAHYDPRSQIITLESYIKSDLKDMNTWSDEGKYAFQATIIHEFTHWIDHVSSLWGQRNLVTWLSGITAWKSNDENQFSAVLAARHALKTTKYNTYFTTTEIEDLVEARQGAPWRYSFTAGRAFDVHGKPNIAHPILFTRFATSSGESIGRVPFSPIALMEVNAVAAEMVYDTLHIHQAEIANDYVEAGIRRKNTKDKYLDLLYSAELVEYSVAAHCLANSVRSSEIVLAYRLGARLSEIAMNLPPERFHQIKLPEKYNIFAELHPHFLNKQDVGYAYWCLCQNATYGEVDDLDGWTEEALKNSGLPSRETLKAEALLEMKKLEGSLPHDSKDHLREILHYGISVFEKHGLSRIRNIFEIYQEADAGGRLPMILLGDNTVIGRTDSWRRMTPANIEAWFNEVRDFDKWSESFESACMS